MSISAYIREIGRGKEGARSLTREQSADLMAQVLDRRVSDLELGAFCLAMRIKGETPEEMAGFLDAADMRMKRPPASAQPVVVLPSYNGARKLPGLLTLLALLLARHGLPVFIHGYATESSRVFTSEVITALGLELADALHPIESGQVCFVSTSLLSPGLVNLLEVRRTVGLRNPAHSMVKLMNPVAGPALLITSYTHPEYAHAMSATLTLRQSHAILLRGTEGEPVADPRRIPDMQGFVAGKQHILATTQSGTLLHLPPLPPGPGADETARYIHRVLDGELEVPSPIALQVNHVLDLYRQIPIH